MSSNWVRVLLLGSLYFAFLIVTQVLLFHEFSIVSTAIFMSLFVWFVLVRGREQ